MSQLKERSILQIFIVISTVSLEMIYVLWVMMKELEQTFAVNLVVVLNVTGYLTRKNSSRSVLCQNRSGEFF